MTTTTKTTTKPATKPVQARKTTAKTTATKSATKTASTRKTAAKAATYDTVFSMLKACGLHRINLSHHVACGRCDKNGALTESGKAFFASRALDVQDALRAAMKKSAGKPFAVQAADGTAHKFIPRTGFALSHAPANPGNYAAQVIRAWFAIAVQSVTIVK